MMHFIERLEDAKISLGEWIAGFSGVVVIRFLLETFSSPSAALPAAPDVATMAHYFLFFIGAFISSALIVNIFVSDIAKIMKFLLFLSPILWLPPIVDYLSSGGGGYVMAYLLGGNHLLLKELLIFGGSSLTGGMTLGIKIELAIIILGVAMYVFLKSRNVFKTICAGILTYLLVFFWMMLPNLANIFSFGFSQMMNLSATQALNSIIATFSVSHIALDSIRPVEQVGYLYGVGLLFNLGVAHMIYILDSILFFIWFLSYQRRALTAIFKNVRLGRALHFWFMVAVGIITAIGLGGRFMSWVDGMMVVTVLIAFLCAWLFAVGTNDLVDINIDQVSNITRPLIVGSFNTSLLRATNIFFLIWSLVGGFLAGYWVFFLILVFTAAYYVYSVPPLRLKRVPILATFLIAIASLSAAMSGFYLLSTGKLIGDFPKILALIIIIFFTLCTNIKDIKDIEGDRAEGIATIPTIFGEKMGRMIVGFLFALSFILVGLVLRSWGIVVLSMITAVFGYASVAIGRYREWRTFVVYFIYAILVLVLMFLHIA